MRIYMYYKNKLFIVTYYYIIHFLVKINIGVIYRSGKTSMMMVTGKEIKKIFYNIEKL